MSIDHTPEPWIAARYGKKTTGIGSPGGTASFLIRWRFGDDSTHQNVADVRRILACVNACVGVPTHELEAKAYRARNPAGIAPATEAVRVDRAPSPVRDTKGGDHE